MKYAAYAVITAAVIFSPSVAVGADFEPTVRALTKLQVAVDTGVSYKDYLTLVTQVKLEEKLLSAEVDASNADRVLDALVAAADSFELAGAVWEVMIEFQTNSLSTVIGRDSDYLRTTCPKVSAYGSFTMESCRNELWNLAVERTATAASLVKAWKVHYASSPSTQVKEKARHK